MVVTAISPSRGGGRLNSVTVAIGVRQTVLRLALEDCAQAVSPLYQRTLVAELVTPAPRATCPSPRHDLPGLPELLRLVEDARQNTRQAPRSAKLRRWHVKRVDLPPAISRTVGDVRGEHVDVSLAGHCDCGPPP